jgi:cytochrome c oxidase cbb3-type subunit II
VERFSFVFVVAGLFFFGLAFVVSAWFPMLAVKDLDVKTLDQLAAAIPEEFVDLETQYPEAYEKAFGTAKTRNEAFAEALQIGHDTYVAEGCWHCHSQQVRPWGNDEARYGRKSFPEEYHNVLNMPPLWGTRRIGPDLIRLGGHHSNDWHVAHFYNPPDVDPLSVMPGYPWFYEADGVTPNKTGLSMIAYVQWLGSWLPKVGDSIYDVDAVERVYPAPNVERSAPARPAAAPAKAADANPWGE